MKTGAVLKIIVLTFFCIPNFVFTNNTNANQNIITSKTDTNMSSKIEVLKDDYNNGNNILEPSIDINDDMVKDGLEKIKDDFIDSPIEEDDSELSRNILSNDTPVILTLSESSTIEIDSLVDAPLVSTSINEKNLQKNISESDRKNTRTIETNITQFSSDSIPQNATVTSDDSVISHTNKNVSGDQNEEIPSFSEWAQKRLEEVEKNEQINSSLKGQTMNGKGATAKLRWKNYASLDCGAKVIAANPEAVSPGAVLSPSSDEYKLNTCTSRIWFIVELCEAIQTKRIDLANYELFSSSPKDFIVSVSDRYPTRDWSIVGKFTAKDERDIQSFDLDTHIFGKYIKVEIKSHYGSEHYCPISLFRAYGTSVFEVLQKEDPANVSPTEDDDDDDDDDHIINQNEEHDEAQKNLFSSATDAVMSIVKRAAQALGNKVNNHTNQEKSRILNVSSLINSCSTPSYMISCKNCSEKVFEEVYKIISCDFSYIKKLVEIPLIFKALSNSWICRNFGYENDVVLNSSKYLNSLRDYITSYFQFKYLNGMCHEIAILENRGILNISQHFPNRTENISTEQMINLKVQEPHLSTSEHLSPKVENINRTNSLNLLNISSVDQKNPHTNSNENITYVSQIKPTKTLTPEVQFSQTDVVLNVNDTSEGILSSEKSLTSESAESVSTENFVENNLDATEIEGMDTLEDHLDHFISDFNNDNNQNIPISTTTTTTPQAQKESVFLRLSNRIKVLERNMSLSSQYLEELSRRYKKQVEEMQHLLEKTIATLREESQKKDIRNKQLEDRLDNLTAVMESLVAERQNWILSMYCLMPSILILLGIYFFCRKSTYSDTTRENKEIIEVLRRKSIDIVTASIPIKKKRRPSDQALKIVRCSAQNNEEDKHKPNNQRQRKRKKKNLTRSNSISNIKDNSYTSGSVKSDEESTADWVERNHQVIEDIPFALEESDHTTLEAYPLENELMRLNSANDMPVTPNSNLNRSSSQSDGSHNISPMDRSNYFENHLHNKLNNSQVEPIKKEKKSFKKLFKKVF